jgi:TonB family protein
MPGPTPFVYPTELWDLKVQGETMLMVRVTELGAVDSAYVVSSSGFREFDSAAVRGVHQLRFSPGRQGQRRIAMWTKVPVRFSLDSLPTVGLPPPRNGAHD